MFLLQLPMASIKQLASQTAIYGFTTIIARMLNFALTPLHTSIMEQESFGILNDVYSIIAFLMVILTFGMETAFFRFYSDKDYDKQKVFSTTAGFTIFTGIALMVFIWLFLADITQMLRYQNHSEFVVWMGLIVAMDAISAVPFAKLRADNKPTRFLAIRLSSIGLMVVLNLMFFLLFPFLLEKDIATNLILSFYRPNQGVAYVFIANLIGNGLMMVWFLPDLFRVNLRPHWPLLKKILLYTSPLVLGFIAGIINEKAQYQFMKYLLPQDEYGSAQGIFGAMMKIATFMVLFIQAFRFAAEPFFFNQDGDFKEKISRVMRYFVIVQSLIFLGLVCFTEVLKWTHFIDEKYWEGWHIVPILLFANLLLGINFNLNIWYKLQNKTIMGAYISFFGLAFTIAFNLLLVPKLGYTGAAWATLISYGAMTLFSYYLNQKHNRTPYPLKALISHLSIAVVLAYISFYVLDAKLIYGIPIFIIYGLYIALAEAKHLKTAFKK